MTKITTSQAAKEFDFTPGHLSRLANLRRIRAEKIGRDWLIERESLQEYFNSWQQRKPGRRPNKREESK
ncbi:MAG: helix-turn-helix domain-containing protein [Candidatus Angelobacter sp.]